jgi:hypothetical protein
MGHDTMLIGWPWVDGTHSWLEPTAFAVLALKSAGHKDHPRTREAVRLIIDRMLPDGGANYGNTIVLGQPLLPHVQPTGLAMLALAGENLPDPRIGKSLDYLQRSIEPQTAPASLSYACLGLAAHGRIVDDSDDWVSEALDDTRRGPLAVYEQSLLLLADSPIEPLVGIRKGAPA